MSVTPTGELHEVGLHEMFFSATDRKGVLHQVNDVFVRLARRPREELLGAPHNVIRHPDMPGGVFRTLWRMLLADQPTAGYIVNLAGDGSAYWTLATIVPIPGGYLSVRTRPCVPERVREIAAIYDEVHAVESDARRAGLGAAGVAALGEQRLLAELRDIGCPDYPAFVRDMLPAELDARLGLGGGLEPAAHPGTPGPNSPMLAPALMVEAKLRLLAVDLRGSHQESAEIQQTVGVAQGLLQALSQALTSVRRALLQARVDDPVVMRAGQPLQQRCAEAESRFAAVVGSVSGVGTRRGELRATVALAQLQAEMSGRYLLQNPDSDGGSATPAAMQGLAQALQHGLETVHRELDVDRAGTRAVRQDVGELAATLRVAQLALTRWQLLIGQHATAPDLTRALSGLGAILVEFGATLSRLGEQVDRFGGRAVVFDPAEVAGLVDALTPQIRLPDAVATAQVSPGADTVVDLRGRALTTDPGRTA